MYATYVREGSSSPLAALARLSWSPAALRFPPRVRPHVPPPQASATSPDDERFFEEYRERQSSIEQQLLAGRAPPSRLLYEERDYFLMQLPEEPLKQEYLKYTELYLDPTSQARSAVALPLRARRRPAPSHPDFSAAAPAPVAQPPQACACSLSCARPRACRPPSRLLPALSRPTARPPRHGRDARDSVG